MKAIKKGKTAVVSRGNSKAKLYPKNSLFFVTESKVKKLKIDSISAKIVGLKTFGLLSLPRAWTLPFFSISAKLYESYSKNPNVQKKILINWKKRILDAGKKAGLSLQDEILVRSSGCAEGIDRRGKFYSSVGTMCDIHLALAECFSKLVLDDDLKNEIIPLLIQKKCSPENTKGHLSNERRCYKENRDWMGEIESAGSGSASNFKINIRHWRHKPLQQKAKLLKCPLSAHISKVLQIPAEWAYSFRARIHFEWVWDGRNVYIVQADEEFNLDGHNPVKEHKTRNYHQVNFIPQCIKEVSQEDAKRFSKIHNVFVYLKLKLPTAPLYILDDRNIISQLSNGTIPDSLRIDITELVKGSLVIRTDLATSVLQERQLLARTEQIKDVDKALEWMASQSSKLMQLKHESAFIFHNFIPAQSAAFAYADPHKPFVPIESLWGLPEGLYYNSHDKFVVDTLKTDIDLVSPDIIAKFVVREECNFKRFFVSTTPSGKWETLSIKPPYDWKASISYDDCKLIAYESRRIAKAENRPVSIMWFVGVPPEAYKRSAIPWYHEEFDMAKSRTSLATRTKTPFDKSFLIQTIKDVQALESGMKASNPGDRIRIQPKEESLLREKNLLKKIGELAKAKRAIIVLEGAVLSHAYYQLAQTGAIVEIVHPFIGFEERHAFNKLVRDRVPEIISQRGESVTTAILESEALVNALREKLVEEAYELLDAKNSQSITAELADVMEVIDALTAKLNISENDLRREQVKKKEERGGFTKGIILVETENNPASSKPIYSAEAQLDGLPLDTEDKKPMSEEEFRTKTENLEKRTDRRVAPGQIEIKANVLVPVTRNLVWISETVKERLEDSNGKVISGSIKGQRIGNQWHCEVSVLIDETQLELFSMSKKPMQNKRKSNLISK